MAWKISARRVWQVAVALLFVFPAALYHFSSSIAEKSIDAILQQAAREQARTWASEVDGELSRILARTPGHRPAPDVLRKLRDEAAKFGVVRFQVRSAETRSRPVIAAHQPGDNVQAQAGEDGAVKAMRKVTVALPGAAGRAGGVIEAVVDVKSLHATLFASLHRFLIVVLGIVVLLIGLVLFGYYQLNLDFRHWKDKLSGEDGLTGLPNRAVFMQQMRARLDHAVWHDQHLACFAVDLDNFSNLSAIYGHDTAEQVLLATARNLREVAGEKALLSRLDMDEFAVFAPLDDERDIEALGQRLRAVVRRPIPRQGQFLHVTASVGAVALAPAPDTDTEDILLQACMARCDAQSKGGNRFVLYTPEVAERQQARNRAEALVRQAIEEGGLKVHFQPIIRLADNRVQGFEALVRLPDPQGGFLPTNDLIDIAESLDLMRELTQIVLEKSVRAAAGWPAAVSVAVNLSPSALKSPHLIDLIAQTLQDGGLDAARLEVEVTENLMLEDSPFIRRQLRALKALGVSVVLDDFGAGYSSLSYLWRYRFDKIKIDRAFIHAAETCEEGLSIMRAMLLMGRTLNIPVTAEGIETAEQDDWVRRHRCTFAQGYYYARPMPAEEATRLLAETRPLPAGTPLRAAG